MSASRLDKDGDGRVGICTGEGLCFEDEVGTDDESDVVNVEIGLGFGEFVTIDVTFDDWDGMVVVDGDEDDAVPFEDGVGVTVTGEDGEGCGDTRGDGCDEGCGKETGFSAEGCLTSTD